MEVGRMGEHEEQVAGEGTKEQGPAEAAKAKSELTETVKTWWTTALASIKASVGQLSSTRPWVPATDVCTAEGWLVVRADLPGVQSEDLDVQATPMTLTISGKLEEDDPCGAEFAERGRQRGAFSKTLALPAEIDASQLSAALKRGVLEVRAPLVARAATKVQVQGDTEVDEGAGS